MNGDGRKKGTGRIAAALTRPKGQVKWRRSTLHSLCTIVYCRDFDCRMLKQAEYEGRVTAARSHWAVNQRPRHTVLLS